MTEVQEPLFEEDKMRQRKDILEGDVRFKAGALKDTLKACDAYMKLLTAGPKLVGEIYFRCQQRDLAHDQLRLLESQACELGRLCGNGAATLEEIRAAEVEIEALCEKLGINREEVPSDEPPEGSGVESEELGFDPPESDDEPSPVEADIVTEAETGGPL